MPVVVSEALSRLFWAAADPIGRRIYTQSGRQMEIIGVAADTSSIQLGELDGPIIYEPMHHVNVVDSVLVVQAAGGADTLVPAMGHAIRELDPELAAGPETLAAAIDRLAERYAFMLKVGSNPAVLALVLCLLGIYGVSAFAAAERTREIGVRMALGARAADVVRLFTRATLWPLALGVRVGLAAAAGLGVLFERADLLLGVPAVDPISYTAAGLLVACTALVATCIPARRATRLDPWRALRVD